MGSSSLAGIDPRPLHWEHRVLATGPPGKSLAYSKISENLSVDVSNNRGILLIEWATITEDSLCGKYCFKCFSYSNIHASLWFRITIPIYINTQVVLVVKKKKKLSCQSWRLKRHRFNPWVGKFPWRRAWQPTPVFLPGESLDTAWWATVHRVTKHRTPLKQLSMHASPFIKRANWREKRISNLLLPI